MIPQALLPGYSLVQVAEGVAEVVAAEGAAQDLESHPHRVHLRAVVVQEGHLPSHRQEKALSVFPHLLRGVALPLSFQVGPFLLVAFQVAVLESVLLASYLDGMTNIEEIETYRTKFSATLG